MDSPKNKREALSKIDIYIKVSSQLRSGLIAAMPAAWLHFARDIHPPRAIATPTIAPPKATMESAVAQG